MGTDLLVFLSGAAVLGQNILWSNPPSKNQPQRLHWWSPHPCQKWSVSDRSMIVQVECLHIVFFPKALYRHVYEVQTGVQTSHILKALGGVLFHCSAKFWYLHGSWFLVVHALHLSAAGWSWPAWDPSFADCSLGQLTQSTLGWPVCAVLVASYAGFLVNLWSGHQLVTH